MARTRGKQTNKQANKQTAAQSRSRARSAGHSPLAHTRALSCWAHPCHVRTGTGITPPRLHRDRARRRPEAGAESSSPGPIDLGFTLPVGGAGRVVGAFRGVHRGDGRARRLPLGPRRPRGREGRRQARRVRIGAHARLHRLAGGRAGGRVGGLAGGRTGKLARRHAYASRQGRALYGPRRLRLARGSVP